MGNDTDGLGKTLAYRLRLSSPEQLEREKCKEAERAAYRRKYWQGYAKRIKRGFGTLTPTEYAKVKERADLSGRSVWGQIWAESCAYCNGTVVPTLELANQQRQLITELRRIGNNINQLAKLGHIQARKHGTITARNDDQIGVETLRMFSKLETLIARFDDNITITVESGHGHDH